MADHEFDVVIVGGGSAGCAAAGRLCATTDLHVCLVEAGPDYGPASEGYWPSELLDARVRPGTHDWGYGEEREDGTTVSEPRARVIGGCSAHNLCAALWGMPADYDAWAAAGNHGWTYAELRQLIDQVEQCAEPDATHHGHGGSLPTRIYRDEELSTWQRVFLQAAEAAGFPRLPDLSAPDPPQAVAPFHANVLDHTRWNSAFAFLDPVRELPTLTVYDGTTADRLLFDQENATALICSGGAEVELVARMFILAAGVYGSPAILMRSGIGPSGHLTELGIFAATDSPGVGENLHDHPGVAMRFGPSPAARRAVIEEYRRGTLLQSQVILRGTSGQCTEGFDLHVLPYMHETEAGEWEFMMYAFNMTPRSRGRVLLRGDDPELAPVIERRLLTDPEDRDMAVLADGVIMARHLATFEPLTSTIAAEVDPGLRVLREDQLFAFIRSTVDTYAHPVGTCKMGPATDSQAVVDPTGRVHGTGNVYVADASIIPQIPRANTNLTCMLIGLKVADAVVQAIRDLG